MKKELPKDEQELLECFDVMPKNMSKLREYLKGFLFDINYLWRKKIEEATKLIVPCNCGQIECDLPISSYNKAMSHVRRKLLK